MTACAETCTHVNPYRLQIAAGLQICINVSPYGHRRQNIHKRKSITMAFQIMLLVPSTPAGASIMLWLQWETHSDKYVKGSRATANSATLGNSSSQNRAVAAVWCSILQKCAGHLSPSSYLTFGLPSSYLLFTEEEPLAMQCCCGSSFVHLEGSVLPALPICCVHACCACPLRPRRNRRIPLDNPPRHSLPARRVKQH